MNYLDYLGTATKREIKRATTLLGSKRVRMACEAIMADKAFGD